MSSLTTTNIGLVQRDRLKLLSRKHGVSQVEFINACVEYFHKSQVNPLEPILSPKDEIAKLTKRVDQVVRFIRTQEEKKLDPLLNNLIIVERKFQEMLGQSLTRKDYNKAYVSLGEQLSNSINTLKDALTEYMQYTLDQNKILAKDRNITDKKLENLSETMLALSKLLINKGAIGYRKDDLDRCQQIIEKYGSN
jgi:hypothetical protein